MKALSIQQPWASLIVCGAKDVENRTWDTKYRGKVLIHASSKKVPKNFLDKVFVEWANEITNLVYMGGMDDFDFLPLGAIIGYVDLIDVVIDKMTDSIWDGGEGINKFILKDAYIFDEPITGVNGKLNLWDYPMDENNLPPAHKVELPKIVLEGKNLTLPVWDTIYETYTKEKFFYIYNTETVYKTLTFVDKKTGDDVVKEVDCVTFIQADGTSHTFALPEGLLIFTQQDENGNDCTAPGLYTDEQPFEYFGGVLGEELNKL